MMVLPSGAVVDRNVALKGFTSWLVGGSAEYAIQPRTIDELKEALAFAEIAGLPVTVLGGGTNVLISDQGIRGVTILLRKLSQIAVVESQENGHTKLKIECLAGTSKSELLRVFLKYRLEPALFLAGLPGDVGGGITMNAGVGEMLRPREFVEITEWVDVLRLPSQDVGKSKALVSDPSKIPSDEIKEFASKIQTIRIPAKELNWSYRHCEGWRPGVICRVGLAWEGPSSPDILARVKQANQLRLSKQPLDMPSCGSVFVNPPGYKSGQLIESSNLKGFSIGGAKVSEKHANFIVNFDQATAEDIHRVIEHVRSTVMNQSGIELRTEVVYLGDW